MVRKNSKSKAPKHAPVHKPAPISRRHRANRDKVSKALADQVLTQGYNRSVTITQDTIEYVAEVMARNLIASSNVIWTERQSGDPLSSSSIWLYFVIAAYRYLGFAGVLSNMNTNDWNALPNFSNGYLLPSAFCLFLSRFGTYTHPVSKTRYTTIVQYQRVPAVTQCSLVTAGPGQIYEFEDPIISTTSADVSYITDATALDLDTASTVFDDISSMIQQSIYGEHALTAGDLLEHQFKNNILTAIDATAHAVRIGPPGSTFTPSSMANRVPNYSSDLGYLFTIGQAPSQRTAPCHKPMSVIPQPESEEFLIRSFLHTLSCCPYKNSVASMLAGHPYSTRKNKLRSPFAQVKVVNKKTIQELVLREISAHVGGGSDAPVTYDSTANDSELVVQATRFSTYLWAVIISKIMDSSGPMANNDFEIGHSVGPGELYNQSAPGSKLPALFAMAVSDIGIIINDGVITYPAWSRSATSATSEFPNNWVEAVTANPTGSAMFGWAVNLPSAAVCVDGYEVQGVLASTFIASMTGTPNVIPVIMLPQIYDSIADDPVVFKTDLWVSPAGRYTEAGPSANALLETGTARDVVGAVYTNSVTNLNAELSVRQQLVEQLATPYPLTPSLHLHNTLSCVYASGTTDYLTGMYQDASPLAPDSLVGVSNRSEKSQVVNRVYGRNGDTVHSLISNLLAADIGPDSQLTNAFQHMITNDINSLVTPGVYRTVNVDEYAKYIEYILRHNTMCTPGIQKPVGYSDMLRSGSLSQFMGNVKRLVGGTGKVAELLLPTGNLKSIASVLAKLA